LAFAEGWLTMNSTSKHRIAARNEPVRPAFPIADLLLESLHSLAQAGEAENACRLAGRTYALLRTAQPDVARRFDVFLHRLTPRLTWTEPPRQAGHIVSHDPAIADARLPSTSGERESDR